MLVIENVGNGLLHYFCTKMFFNLTHHFFNHRYFVFTHYYSLQIFLLNPFRPLMVADVINQ
jgi:hypothetical protein